MCGKKVQFSMTKNAKTKKVKQLLAIVLDFYLKNKDFPDKKKFRIEHQKDWDLLDELVEKRYFSDSSHEERNKYILTLKGLCFIENQASKEILNIGNKLLPVFKKFYVKNLSDDYIQDEEIAKASKLNIEKIRITLFFIRDMYPYFRGAQHSTSNKFLCTSIGLYEDIIHAKKTLQEYAKDRFEEKEEKHPSLLEYKVGNAVKAKYGEDRLVAFLDVLGFKELLDDKKRIELYFNKIIKILRTLKTVEGKSEIEYALISDSVVLSFPFRNRLQNLNEFLTALGRIQAELCLENIWLRGAVTIGSIKMQRIGGNQVVFGKGLSEAYIMESKHAKYPRILIDPKIIKRLKRTREKLMNELASMNTNSIFFKSILFDPSVRSYFSEKDVPGAIIANDGVWINFFEYVRSNKIKFNKFIEDLKENLYLGQEHYEKYKWLQSYALLEYSSRGGYIQWDEHAALLAGL